MTINDKRFIIITEQRNAKPRKEEKIFALNIGFEPSTDGIEKTIYNSNSFNYGGVASRTVGMRE